MTKDGFRSSSTAADLLRAAVQRVQRSGGGCSLAIVVVGAVAVAARLGGRIGRTGVVASTRAVVPILPPLA